MTRQQYLTELKFELRTLPVEEQEEALEYYRGYFEDADNDEEVMREFGSPQDLAATIRAKFAGTPATIQHIKEEGSAEGSYGNFSGEKVRGLDISLGAAEIVMAKGTQFSVSYRGIDERDIHVSLSPFGTFTVENTGRFPSIDFWRHSNESCAANHPRILILIPEHTKLDILRLHVGAGSFSAKDVDITTARSYIDVGAGNIVLNKVSSGAGHLHCGMGNITYTGSFCDLVKVDCGMGNISLNLSGNEDDYSIFAKVGVGSVKMNDRQKSGIGNLFCQNKKQNHFSVNCGIGAVTIKIK